MRILRCMDRAAASKHSQGTAVPAARPDRIEERTEAMLPVALQGGGSGITRDISASGVFFKTREAATVGERIEFTIEFDDAGGKRSWTMTCLGEVVRVERGDAVLGVAARIVESKLAFKGRAGQRPEEVI
jgi:hypothetical protein